MSVSNLIQRDDVFEKHDGDLDWSRAVSADDGLFFRLPSGEKVIISHIHRNPDGSWSVTIKTHPGDEDEEESLVVVSL